MTSPGTTNWRRCAAVAAIILGVTVLYWPTSQSLDSIWRDTDRITYTHGYLIVAMSAWLLWRARVALARADATPTLAEQLWRALLLLALAVAWLISYRAGVQIAQQILLPALLGAALLALLGRNAFRTALAPLALLYFAIPIWDYFNFAALWTTTQAVHFMLSLAGVPAYFDGNHVQIPAGDFEIAGGCSGMHYIIVALALATLLGELRADRWSQRVRWWLFALALAVLVNWVRVFIVIYAGHLSQMQHYLVRESHYGFGWALFSLVIIALLILDRRTPIRADAAPASPAGTRALPPPALLAVSVFLLGLPWLLNATIDARTPRAADWSLPVAPAHCEAMADSGAWQPRQNFPDHEARGSYRCDAIAVQTYAAWYRQQHQGKKLGGYDNRLQGAAEVLARQLQYAGEREFLALQLREKQGDSLLWITYRVADREFTSATRAQLWYSLLTLRSLRSPVSVAVAARAVCEPDCETARQVLSRFTHDGGFP